MEKRNGARDGKQKTGGHAVTPLLSDIGVTKKQSSRWQREAMAERRAGELLAGMEKHN